MSPLTELERALGARIREEEAHYERDAGRKPKKIDTLWGHLQRVAGFAEKLGRAEGLDPVACRLAGLFHDAGKFVSGVYHAEGQIEEEQSVQVLHELTADAGLDPALLDEVATAILQLYRETRERTPLGAVLFDADNLDKLGPLGVANFFVKSGLRGRGISTDLLYQLTVELTYARYAEPSMATAAGRELARERAAQTIEFIHGLLDTLRADGVFDLRVTEATYDDLTLDVVAPRACDCGGELERRVWGEQGVKCHLINLEHRCGSCEARHVFRFCRPRLVE